MRYERKLSTAVHSYGDARFSSVLHYFRGGCLFFELRNNIIYNFLGVCYQERMELSATIGCENKILQLVMKIRGNRFIAITSMCVSVKFKSNIIQLTKIIQVKMLV